MILIYKFEAYMNKYKLRNTHYALLCLYLAIKQNNLSILRSHCINSRRFIYLKKIDQVFFIKKKINLKAIITTRALFLEESKDPSFKAFCNFISEKFLINVDNIKTSICTLNLWNSIGTINNLTVDINDKLANRVKVNEGKVGMGVTPITKAVSIRSNDVTIDSITDPNRVLKKDRYVLYLTDQGYANSNDSF